MKKNIFIFVVCFVLYQVHAIGQSVKIELYKTSKSIFYSNECVLSTYKIYNLDTKDISVDYSTVVRDSRGKNIANYSYIKVHASHAVFPDSVTEYKLESRKWSIDSTSSFVIKKGSWIMVSKTINDCMEGSCNHKARVPFLTAEGHLPVGKYTVVTTGGVNNGETFKIEHGFEIKKPNNEFGLIMNDWNIKMEDYRKGKGEPYPFEPDKIYAFFDDTKNILARDRMMTRLPLYFESQKDIDLLLKYIPQIQDPNILLQSLLRITDETIFYYNDKFGKMEVNRLGFYKQLAISVMKANKIMAQAFVKYLIAKNDRPGRHFNVPDKSLILSSLELNELEALLNK